MNGTYFLNGNWDIDSPTKLHVAGTVFDYHRDIPETGNPEERLMADGPTAIELYVVVGMWKSLKFVIKKSEKECSVDNTIWYLSNLRGTQVLWTGSKLVKVENIVYFKIKRYL